MTDLVLYVIDGGFRLGTVEEILTTETLSELYRAPVEVIRRGDRIIVVGAADSAGTHHPHETATESGSRR
jgi:zinc/manganese transport system ATP-binding protein